MPKRSGVAENGALPPKKSRRITDEAINESQGPDFINSQTMATEREAGIIEEVVLQNFMSHNKLHFKFGKHVNFVIGLNGSGKSTILTAIIVGLGGRAALTDRGNSLKSFVKNGCTKATVSVFLRNRGVDAYKKAVYGDSIRVQRTITDKGQSSYAIYGADGCIKSKERIELDAILDAFNILIDNPMVVLNQDTSKEFMLSKTPSDFYRFFLRATQLEQIEKDHSEARLCKQQASEDLKLKRDLLPAMKHEVQVWEQKFNACASIDKLNGRIDKLKEEMAWAFVWEKEKILEQVTKELSAKEESRPKYVSAVEKCEKKIAEKSAHHKQVTEELKKAGDEASVLEASVNDLKSVVNQKKKSAKSAADSLRQCNIELQGINSDRKEIALRIEQLQNEAPVDYTAQREERERSIIQLQKELADETTKLKTIEFTAEQFHSAAMQCQQNVNVLKGEGQELNRKLDAVNKRLRELESSRGDELKRFGAFMPELVKLIDEAFRRGKFNEKPRGPIGANIKLKDKKWAVAIEKCISAGPMSAFVINDHKDEKIFEEIAKRVCGKFKPTTYVGQFQASRHPVPNNPLSDQFPTVLEMLDIKDHIIANCLIDERRIEFVLLAENRDAGINLMTSGRSGNYGELFTLTGDHIFSQPCFRLYSSNGETARYLTANLEQLINAAMLEKQQLVDVLTKQRDKILQAEHERTQNVQEQNVVSAKQQNVRSLITNIKLRLSELKNTEIVAPVNVQALEDEEQILNQKISDLQVNRQNLLQTAEDSSKALREAEANLKVVENKIRVATEKLEPYRTQLADFDVQLDRIKQEEKHYKMKLKDFEKEISEIKKRHDVSSREVAETREKAVQIKEEPVRTRRTAQNVECEMIQIQKQITIEQKTRGNPEEIKKIYEEKNKRFEDIQEELEALSCFIDKLSTMINKRDKWLMSSRESISLSLKVVFTHNLHVRSEFGGRLEIDHKNKVIDMVVFPRSGLSESDMVSNKSLSGGERSFSTACFILSLWDCMETPFRCLDEFDVFMDLVNRRLCMEMMIKTAAMKPGCQFVFLSPLSMSQLNLDVSSVDVKIFEMAAPRKST